MFSFKQFLTEEKNTHLEHLEDDIINYGAVGGRNAVNFLKSIRDMLVGNSSGKVNVSVKWDGAPAIICGTNPENGKFFVGTKSVFNVTPKVNYTSSDIRKNHEGNLATKLIVALKELKKLNIRGVVQGDLLFTPGEIKKAKNQYLIEEENFKLVKQEVILESAEVFLELLEQKKLIELNKLKEHRFTKDLESIELLFKVGKASQSDLIFVKSELIKIVAEKIASINKLEFIEIKYKSIVGDFIPKSQLEEPKFKNINLPENYVTAETIALKNNPKYRKLLIEEKISKNEVRSQFADALPNITLDAEYRTADDFSSKGSSSDTAEITAELTIPLFRGGKNLSKIKQAKLIAKKVRYDLENKKNETILEVKNSWTNYKSSEVKLKSAKISYEAKKLILEGIEQEAKLGMRSYIDVLKSKEDLIDAEFEKIKANHQLILSALKLKANIGELSLKNLDI